jgi:PAS domain S-box-containing protein
MNVYTLLTFITSALCVLVGNFIYYRNKNSSLHLMFASGYYLAGAYCFFLAGFYLARDAEEAWLWLRLTAIGHMVAPLSFIGILMLMKGIETRLKRTYILLIFCPYIFLFFQDVLFTGLTYDTPQRTGGGWITVMRTSSPFHALDLAIYIVMMSIEFYLLIRFIVSTVNKPKRKLAFFLLLNVLVPIAATALLLLVFPFFLNPVMRVESLVVLFVVLTTAIGLYRFNIFDLTTEILSRDIVANMSTFYVLVDKDIQILETNGKTLELFGYTSSELSGKPLRKLFDADKYEALFRHSGTNAYTLETWCRSNDDRSIPVILSIRPVHMKNEFLGFIIIGSDLSEVKKIQVEKEIAELELKALVSQMNPHFMFNSLNTIQHFITLNDERTANLYLSKFAGLMRRILDNSTQANVKLAEEMECLTLYLDLEVLRLKDKFNYKVHIDPDINVFEESIPPMIIQPFVENAIWHGIHPKDGPGLLQISVARHGGGILCSVDDNGIGRERSRKLNQAGRTKHQSRAIKNIERRIHLLNRKEGTLPIQMEIIDKKMQADEGQGTTVKIYFPGHIAVVKLKD